MPCACNIPIPNAPTNEVWGPIFWKLLHGLAEKIGSTMLQVNITEERIAWIQLIKSTEKVLPCPYCREHYKDYLKRNNPDILKNYDVLKMKIWITNFFWSLHEEINQENNKESLEFESVSILYKNIDLNKNMKDLESIMKIVFQHNGVSLLSWQNWTNQFKKLKSFYGI